MMGRTTLREIREALAAARSAEVQLVPATPTVDELESLGRSLEGQESETPAPLRTGASAQASPAEPNEALGQAGSPAARPG